jgi:hypothetical protein
MGKAIADMIVKIIKSIVDAVSGTKDAAQGKK